MESADRTEQDLTQLCARISELERQLRRAQRLESVGTLAGGIAHDFNNILFLIVGYTEMCLERLLDDPPTRQYMEKVLEAAGRARTLIEQIHTFSRDDERTKRPLRFQAVVKESLKLLRSAIPSTIRIEPHIGSDCPQVEGDPVRLRQVMVALCSRAVASSEQRGGLLTVLLEPLEAKTGACHLRLSISCRHGGSPPDRGRKTPESGLDKDGAGLSVVREIIEDHGGVLSVPECGGGESAFQVLLPTVAPERSWAPVPAPPGALKGSERLLIVDDEAELLGMVQTMLEGLGYHVTAAAGGREALALFSRDPDRFDLVATDLTMPDLTGLELAEEMLRLRPDLPVVLCSGFHEGAVTDRMRSAAIREVVAKPAACSELVGAIRRALR